MPNYDKCLKCQEPIYFNRYDDYSGPVDEHGCYVNHLKFKIHSYCMTQAEWEELAAVLRKQNHDEANMLPERYDTMKLNWR